MRTALWLLPTPDRRQRRSTAPTPRLARALQFRMPAAWFCGTIDRLGRDALSLVQTLTASTVFKPNALRGE